MPKSMFKKMPAKAAKLWEAAYKNAISRKKTPEQAGKIAWGIIKKSYAKKKGIWVAKSLFMKQTLLKSGFFKPEYSFEIEISNNQWDSQNQRVDERLLESLVMQNNIDYEGDVDHEVYAEKLGRLNERNLINSDRGTKGLYNIDSVTYEDGKVLAVVKMNKKHSLYSKYVGLHKSGKYLYASAEFPNATIENGVIIDADKLGFTITNDPVNYGASIKKVFN